MAKKIIKNVEEIMEEIKEVETNILDLSEVIEEVKVEEVKVEEVKVEKVKTMVRVIAEDGSICLKLA